VLEMSAIVYFRMIGTSLETRRQLHSDFGLAFGHDHGSYYAAQFEELHSILAKYGRRQVMRHDIDCKCFCGDEAAIANMIVRAAKGDIQDAELMAGNLVPCETAPTLVAVAEQVGLALILMLERFPLPVLTSYRSPSQYH